MVQTIRLFVIFADGDLDIICENLKPAALHMSDLDNMGCSVKAYEIRGDKFKAWQCANQIEAILQDGKKFTANVRKQFADGFSVSISLWGYRQIIRRALKTM